LDIQSRSFGIITKNPKLVREAVKLFQADFDRQPYVSGYDRFIVSPENSRDRLARLIKGACRELLIYDPQVTDDAMLRLLVSKQKAGVDVKIIGKVEGKWELKGEKSQGKRLHIRAIVCDRHRAFLGSQSLRRVELDKRREVGIIINDQSVVSEVCRIFDGDWAQTETGKKEAKKAEKAEKKEEKEEAKKAS
ncbi:MAG: hypothetical protein HY655_01920, partial [Acidobacteria bacterium]|nr:hypothetical protein [Acidobacteriota bacterium]